MLRPKFHKNLKAGILLLLVSFCELDAAAPVHGTSETGVSQLPEILLGARVGIGAAQEVVHCLGFAAVACRVVGEPPELHARLDICLPQCADGSAPATQASGGPPRSTGVRRRRVLAPSRDALLSSAHCREGARRCWRNSAYSSGAGGQVHGHGGDVSGR